MKDLLLIKRAVITEKSVMMGGKDKYVFVVKSSANKSEIKKAIKELYKVEVLDVNTINIPDKNKRFRNMQSVKRGYKKAVVTLKPGQKIEETK